MSSHARYFTALREHALVYDLILKHFKASYAHADSSQLNFALRESVKPLTVSSIVLRNGSGACSSARKG
jgi:hypothetical protein